MEAEQVIPPTRKITGCIKVLVEAVVVAQLFKLWPVMHRLKTRLGAPGACATRQSFLWYHQNLYAPNTMRRLDRGRVPAYSLGGPGAARQTLLHNGIFINDGK
jgi:hypothetical protein